MTWQVVVTRERVFHDGPVRHVVTELFGPPTHCETQADAEAVAQRIRNASHDPTLDVAVVPPTGWVPPPQGYALDERTRQTGREGLAAARASLRRIQDGVA